MISGTADRWERLGALLIQRRTQLAPRFHNRGAFCEATGLKYRLIYDIEEARRTNFGGSTIAAIEAAYQLPPGAIGRFLDGGELVRAPQAPQQDSGPTLPVLRNPAPGVEDHLAVLREQYKHGLLRLSEREKLVWAFDVSDDIKLQMVAILREARERPVESLQRATGLTLARNTR